MPSRARAPRALAAAAQVVLTMALAACGDDFTLAEVDGASADDAETDAGSGTPPADVLDGDLDGSASEGATGEISEVGDVASRFDASAMADQDATSAPALDASIDPLRDATSAPSTLLDDFQREDGPPRGAWAGGDLDAFAIERGRLVVKKDGCFTIFFTSSAARVAQEAHVTLKSIPERAGEINLVLKARSASGCQLIEADYRPRDHLIGVYGCESAEAVETWTEGGPLQPAALAEEHVFKATVDENGNVRLYDNDLQLAAYVAPNWGVSKNARSSIGLSVCDAVGAEFDDFGGLP